MVTVAAEVPFSLSGRREIAKGYSIWVGLVIRRWQYCLVGFVLPVARDLCSEIL